jgi:hypothetical protein
VNLKIQLRGRELLSLDETVGRRHLTSHLAEVIERCQTIVAIVA